MRYNSVKRPICFSWTSCRLMPAKNRSLRFEKCKKIYIYRFTHTNERRKKKRENYTKCEKSAWHVAISHNSQAKLWAFEYNLCRRFNQINTDNSTSISFIGSNWNFQSLIRAYFFCFYFNFGFHSCCSKSV